MAEARVVWINVSNSSRGDQRQLTSSREQRARASTSSNASLVFLWHH